MHRAVRQEDPSACNDTSSVPDLLAPLPEQIQRKSAANPEEICSKSRHMLWPKRVHSARHPDSPLSQAIPYVWEETSAGQWPLSGTLDRGKKSVYRHSYVPPVGVSN